MQQNNTPIFVINLEKSVERKAAIQSQFQSIQAMNPDQLINYQFFPAVYGKENPEHPLFKKHNPLKRFLRKGNQMSLSQLGCYASHYLLWQKCVELDQPIIVLEDDAILKSNFLQVYQYLNHISDKFEFFWLSPPAPARRNQTGKLIVRIDEQNCIQQYYKPWGNATGYYLTPAGAKKFLAQSAEWIYDVDIAMERYWENKIQYYAVSPACVEPNFDLETNIPVDKGKKQRTLLIRLRRELYKLQDNINKLIFDITHK